MILQYVHASIPYITYHPNQKRCGAPDVLSIVFSHWKLMNQKLCVWSTIQYICQFAYISILQIV